MTNYRIGPESDHIDPQKRRRGMKLYSFTVRILGGRYLALFDLVAYKHTN